MGLEIERKFLVISDAWTDLARNAARLEQGYLAFAGAAGPEARVRVSTPLGCLDGHGFSENPEPKTFQDAFQDAVEYAFIPLPASSGALENEAATATFTVKGKGTISRTEIESDIPVRDAVDILAMCEATVKKVRHTIAWGLVSHALMRRVGSRPGFALEL